jgi:hypothetical protein
MYGRLAWRFVLKKCFFSFLSKVWLRVSFIEYHDALQDKEFK